MLNTISKGIDAFNKKEGEISSLLVIALLAVVIYEVFMRYAFNAPTIWGFEATTFIYGVHYMAGYAYTDVLDGHVKVDIFTSRMSTKAQAVLSILTNLVIFLPVFSVLTFYCFGFAIISTKALEVNSTSWAPPIWPFKLIMAVCFLFLLLQGVSSLLKNIRVLYENRD
jgi:TRAP-type mannitol/chloroaromatic compound transport system permease small subunit